LKKRLSDAERLRIATEVGSDVPLFLIGGTVLGVGRGEEVYPLPDLPAMPCVIALPDVAVSTPKAFAEWDQQCGAGTLAREAERSSSQNQARITIGKGTALSRAELARKPDYGTTASRALPREREAKQVPRLGNHSQATDSASLGMTSPHGEQKLTSPTQSDRMLKFSREISAWLGAVPGSSGRRRSGVSARGGGRAENLLLDLVRTGIENDFERVVFPQYPELGELKRVLAQAGARYASLSGSGAAIYGLFASREVARAAAAKLTRRGTRALVTSTLTRRQYWNKL
jgi:4-diphosphocytidyl-2-C-methyl-D-erythritol kinase